MFPGPLLPLLFQVNTGRATSQWDVPHGSPSPPGHHIHTQHCDKGFSLHLTTGHDELNVSGDVLWCLNLMDHLLLFLSEIQKQSRIFLEVGVLYSSQG